MHGQLVSLLVEPDQSVEKDQRLAVFEAMKMQHEILAPVAGVVQQLNGQVGQQMAAGDVIMVIEEAEASRLSSARRVLKASLKRFQECIMQQASDFLAESEALEQLIAPLQAQDFSHHWVQVLDL